MNKNALYYLEHLDAFEIMESHIMDRVMQEYWQGNLDASGSFLEASTAFGILTHFDSRFSYDYEQLNRFYLEKDVHTISPHKLNFVVVRNSMQVRYYLEICFFLSLALYIQFEIQLFSNAFNEFSNTLSEYKIVDERKLQGL